MVVFDPSVDSTTSGAAMGLDGGVSVDEHRSLDGAVSLGGSFALESIVDGMMPRLF